MCCAALPTPERCGGHAWPAASRRKGAYVLRSTDRLLSDEARTAALESAADAATAGGRCSALVLGAGSLLPALLFARRGAAVCVVEASPLLADVVRAAAVENGVRLAVLSSLASASAAYRQPGVSPPSLLVSEAVDDGLLADGVLPSLRAARALLASSRCGGGDAVAVLPRAASVEACRCYSSASAACLASGSTAHMSCVPQCSDSRSEK